MAKTKPLTAPESVSATDLALTEQRDNAVAFEISADTVAFAAGLGIDLTGTTDARVDLAATHMNRSQLHMLASGLLLASVRAECEYGQFGDLLAARGFEPRAAQRAMQYAAFVVSRPADERARLIEWPKSKVMQLAGADPEVIGAVLSDDAARIDSLSVRGLQDRIRELEAAAVDITTQRDTAEAEAEGLRKQLRKASGEREDHVPVVVADLRAEIAALHRKAELALQSFGPLGAELANLRITDGADEWADATLRLAVSALSAVHLQVTGLLKTYVRELPGEDATPTDRSRFTRQEVLETAQRYAELTQVHDYERTLREWEREQARPRGKGRPTAKPEAPKAAAKGGAK